MKKFHGAKIILVPLSRQFPHGHPHRRVRGCGPGGTPSREQGLKLGEGPQSKCPLGWFSMLRPWEGRGAPGAPGGQRPGLWRCLRTSCALAPGGPAPKEGHPCAPVSALRPDQPTEGGGCYCCVASLGVSLPCCGRSPGIPHCFLMPRAPALSLQRRGCKSSQVGKGAPAACGEAGRWADTGGPAACPPTMATLAHPLCSLGLPCGSTSPDPSPPSLFSWTPKRSYFGDNAGLGWTIPGTRHLLVYAHQVPTGVREALHAREVTRPVSTRPSQADVQ